MKGNKIDIVERILMLLLVLAADSAEFLATLSLGIPFLGETLSILATFFGFMISLIILGWLIMKGVSIKWFLGGSGIDLIPIINAMPTKTAAIIATFVEDSLPKLIEANQEKSKPKNKEEVKTETKPENKEEEIEKIK